MLEAGNFGFRKKRNYTIHVAKTKALISFAVTAKLICVFVLAYADCWFSHDPAHYVNDKQHLAFKVFTEPENISPELDSPIKSDGHGAKHEVNIVQSRLSAISVVHVGGGVLP